MHLRMTLNGTMSGFTMRTPTEDELKLDPAVSDIEVVHVTSDAPWKPNSSKPAMIEEALRNHVETGYEFHHKTSRELNQVSVRGQIDDAAFSANVRTEDLSYDGLTDHHYAV